MRRVAAAVACVPLVVAAALVAAPSFGSAHPLLGASNCTLFPATNPHLLDRFTGKDFEVVNTSSLPRPGL